MRAKLTLLFAAAIALSAGLGLHRYLAATPLPTALPDTRLLGLDGQEHGLRDWQGKILIVNFWATWCPPCRKEIPEFIKLQRELQDRGLQFVGIAVEEAEPVREFAASVGINYPVLLGEEGGIELSAKLGNLVNVLPYSAVIDRDGRLLHSHPGVFESDQILAVVGPLLEPAGEGNAR